MKNKKGFTLVELVIVIAVIAILAAVLLPTFASLIERAKESAKLQQVTNIRDEYMSDYGILPQDLKNYVIEIDEKLYLIEDENGTLTGLDGSLKEHMATSNLMYEPQQQDGYVVYIPTEIKYGIKILNDQNEEIFISWYSDEIHNYLDIDGTTVIVKNEYRDKITYVALPFEITNISEYAFAYCPNLKEVLFHQQLR